MLFICAHGNGNSFHVQFFGVDRGQAWRAILYNMSYSAALLLWLGVSSGSDTPIIPPEQAGDRILPTKEQSAQNALWRSWVNAIQRQEIQRQVRIERRITIRIPRTSRSRTPLSAINQTQLSKSWKEKKIGKCLPMKSIAGVQISGSNQLLLYTNDRRMIRARLEKVCRARDFYSGFYLEQSKDGKLCVDRDVLQARSGAKCELERIRQLVPDDD